MLDGADPETQVYPPLPEVEAAYRRVFAARELPLPPPTARKVLKHPTFYPISKKELEEILKFTNSSSPGPDGVTREDLLRVPVRHLAALYRVFLDD